MSFWDNVGYFFNDLSAAYFSIPRLLCLCALIIGYFFGMFQSAYFISKAKHVDIYSQGSGNPGTTNMFRVMGAKAGLLTFVLDIAKVVIAIFLAQYIFLTWLKLPIDPIALKLYTGFGAVLGHNFPVYLRGKGGKGVAATCAVYICLGEWKYIVIGLAIFLIIFLVTRYVSLASMSVVTVSMFEFLFFSLMNWTYVDPDWLIDCQVIVILFAVLCLVMHRKNIIRLLYGEESRFRFRKPKPEETEELPEDWEEEYGDFEMEEPDEKSLEFLAHADSLFAEHADFLAAEEAKEAEEAAGQKQEDSEVSAPAAEPVVFEEAYTPQPAMSFRALSEKADQAAGVTIEEEPKETEEASLEETETIKEVETEEPKESETEEAAKAEEPVEDTEVSDSTEEVTEVPEEDADTEEDESESEETSEEDTADTDDAAPKRQKRSKDDPDYRTNHNKQAPAKKKKKHSTTKKKKSNSAKKKKRK